MSALKPSVDETIERAQARTKQYWYEDGAVDLGVSAVFLMIACLFALQFGLPESSALQGISAIGLPLIIIGGYYLARWIVGSLKARFTYPRTGLVDYERPARGHARAAAVVAGLTGFVIAIFITRAEIDSWIPALQGIAFGALLLRLAQSLQVGRYTLLAVVSIAIGLLSSWAGLDSILGSAIVFGGLGLGLLISGALTLRTYLRAAPAPEVDPEAARS
jgi:hypothetical protein